MPNAGKLSAVILATGIALLAGGPRVSAQTSNVVIQWNQTGDVVTQQSVKQVLTGFAS